MWSTLLKRHLVFKQTKKKQEIDEIKMDVSAGVGVLIGRLDDSAVCCGCETPG